MIFQDPVDKTWWYEDLEGKFHGPYSSEARAQERYQGEHTLEEMVWSSTSPANEFGKSKPKLSGNCGLPSGLEGSGRCSPRGK